ncbi:DNA repair exonuclease [Candidatus Dojkabacteria bacterium]|nr:DNA repair exonuclease [Candidatus Dojkabacteria bacterium]
MKPLKILHTSDIHLEAKVGFLGANASEFRKQLVNTFENLVNVAKEQKVQLVLISGDLFDTPFPSNTAIEIVKKTLLNFAEAGIYVALIPGNHDYMADGSVYKTKDLSQGNEKIIVFNDPNKQVFEIAELRVRLHAKANTTQKSQTSPLPQLNGVAGQNPQDDFFNIALAHGSFEVKGEKSDNFPITQEEIENSGFDYIALGDWHGMLDTGAIKTRAFYPGSIEPLAVDQKNAGNVLIVSLEKGKEVKVEPLRVGKFEIVEFELDTSKTENILKSLEESITVTQGASWIVSVVLTGTKSIEKRIEVEKIEEYFAGRYFLFKITDKTELKLTEEDLQKYPEHTVIGKFIEIVEGRGDLDDLQKQKVLEKGVSLLMAGN